MSYAKVALAGATGNLGPAILAALLDAGFQVTVLTRESSKHSFPSSVTVKPVDYASLDSLTAALTGQDAFVSTLASAALDRQLLLVEAAAKAGVKRFIPSEFGSNTTHAKTSQLPVFAPKVAVQEALKKEADAAGGEGGMSYTLINNGPFLDWGLKVGLIAHAGSRSINMYDGGDRTFSTTTLSTIGKTVAAVLKKPAETRNRVVFVQDTAISLKKVAEIAKKVTGEDWKQTQVSVDDVTNQGWEELKKDKPDPGVFALKFIIASIFGEGYGSRFEKPDNELLGIEQMSDAELEQLVADVAK